MPKAKKTSSSDSDSGPDDQNPPPSKKSKESSKSKESGDKSNQQWVLERQRKVSINEFRGHKLIDIREYYEKDGKSLPGKKGISLSVDEWKKLLAIAEEVNRAIE